MKGGRGQRLRASALRHPPLQRLEKSRNFPDAKLCGPTGSRGYTRFAEPRTEENEASVLSTESTGRALGEEVFGPLGLVVRMRDLSEMKRLARGFEGQLTATMHLDDGDIEAARRLLPILERKAGRVLVNGFPTGVEVVDSMVHGGPYPASTNFGATSVGTLSIRRFLRPVAYQNLPEALLTGLGD